MVVPIDLVIHVPLEAEYLELREVFPVVREIEDDLNVIAEVQAPGGITAVLIVQEKMGRSSALQACSKILSLYKPDLYVCLGIAGGLSKDLSLGDVCYTGVLADVNDNAKVSDVPGGGLDIALSPDFYSTPRGLTAALGFVRTLPSLSNLHDNWRNTQHTFSTSVCPEPVIGRDEKLETIGLPKCLNGDVVCGLVSESDAYRARLRGVTRNILAVETESGPIFETCDSQGIPAITIRGISDYANASKGKLEGSTKESIRKIAARNAATFLHMQLQNQVFRTALAKIAGKTSDEEELPLETKSSSPVAEALEAISLEVDLKLRELSPSYKTKPIGYRLPAPRMRQKLASGAGDPKQKPVEIEFLDALSSHHRILLYIPRNYPDQALPWMLANALLTSDISGKKALPVVIDGSKISPPRSGIASNTSLPLDANLGSAGGAYIFIIDEPPFGSRTKMSHLSAEMKNWPNSRFVFLTRKDKAIVEDADSISSLKLDTFSLCDVSFMEIAAFIESTFELPSQEAEVIALKLRTMFKKFSLPAHPSFFAGIPSDALAALLSANRRSELIQLAVDGFLSFVVANDKSRGKLSRTSRTRFLRRLAVELIHEKRSFDRSELLKFTKAISDEYDYGLDPDEFVRSFEDAGLIHFEGGGVSITLPFMASYLFADEMSKDTALASAYLASVGEEPDLSIYDLYAEIGPSRAAVQRANDMLAEAISALPKYEEPHILLTGRISPVVFKNPARLANLGQKVSEARVALSNGASDRDEKARVLDIADRVSESVEEESKKQPDAGKASEEASLIRSLIRRWTTTTVMLGSGAEGIIGSDRLGLTQTVIHGAEVFLDAVLRQIHDFDFERIKRHIIDDTAFRESLGVSDDTQFENLVSALVDLVEFVALSDPLDQVFDHLPDRAGHQIIANSVSKAEASTQIQNLIKKNWLTNIDPHNGKTSLLIALHDLPHVQFLRAGLTSIYMMRTRWRVPDFETRMALLDAAAEAVRPYNPNLDKGEVRRFVQSHVPGTPTDDDIA